MSSGREVRVALARRRLIKQLQRAGARTDATAHPLEVDSPLERKVLQGMLRREVIRPGRKGGYWLDEERYAEWKRRQFLFVFGALLVAGGIVACILIYEPSHPRHHPAAADSAASEDSVPASRPAGEAPPP